MVSDIRITCPNNDVAERAAGKLQPRPLCCGDILPRRLCERYSSTSDDNNTAATERDVCVWRRGGVQSDNLQIRVSFLKTASLSRSESQTSPLFTDGEAENFTVNSRMFDGSGAQS